MYHQKIKRQIIKMFFTNILLFSTSWCESISRIHQHNIFQTVRMSLYYSPPKVSPQIICQI